MCSSDLANYTGFSTPNYHDYKVEACFDYSDSLVLVGSPLGKLVVFDLINEKIAQEVSHSLLGPVVSLTSHSSRDRVATAAGNVVTIFDNN